ncbi:MAG TPA: hypothetical protein VE029_14565, partial [Rhizobacter sp.]|nr:hypothetical protein [Rhizobacter sp.]
MSTAKTLRGKRLEMGLSDVEVAERLGLTVFELGDIEQHDDELETAVSLRTARRLCSLLKLPLEKVLGIPSTQTLPLTL